MLNSDKIIDNKHKHTHNNEDDDVDDDDCDVERKTEPKYTIVDDIIHFYNVRAL